MPPMENETEKKDIFWIPCAVLKPKLKNHEIISSAVAQAMDSTDLCVVQEVLYRSTARVVANIHWNTALQQRNNSTSDSQQHQLVTEYHFWYTATSACDRISLLTHSNISLWQNITSDSQQHQLVTEYHFWHTATSACDRISLLTHSNISLWQNITCAHSTSVCNRILLMLIQDSLQQNITYPHSTLASNWILFKLVQRKSSVDQEV